MTGPRLRNKLLIICGPTATGKSALAFKLARLFKAQLISADSRQVYQGMDIGTGKDYPPPGIKLWGYDLVKPDQEFSLAHFAKQAQKQIKIIHAQKQLPIAVGGTGLYLQSLTQNLDTINIPPNPKLRQQLEKKSVVQLQTKLNKLNLTRFQNMNHSDQNNPRRLIRAIEISLQAPNLKVRPVSKINLDVLWLGLTAPLKTLDQRIESRVKTRIRQEAQQEVKNLIDQGYVWSLPAMSAMGYKQWQPFFQGEINLKHVIKDWQTAEKQYARRQLTWFKKNKQINWFDITQPHWQKQVVNLIRTWYTET